MSGPFSYQALTCQHSRTHVKVIYIETQIHTYNIHQLRPYKWCCRATTCNRSLAV